MTLSSSTSGLLDDSSTPFSSSMVIACLAHASSATFPGRSSRESFTALPASESIFAICLNVKIPRAFSFLCVKSSIPLIKVRSSGLLPSEIPIFDQSSESPLLVTLSMIRPSLLSLSISSVNCSASFPANSAFLRAALRFLFAASASALASLASSSSISATNRASSASASSTSALFIASAAASLANSTSSSALTIASLASIDNRSFSSSLLSLAGTSSVTGSFLDDSRAAFFLFISASSLFISASNCSMSAWLSETPPSSPISLTSAGSSSGTSSFSSSFTSPSSCSPVISTNEMPAPSINLETTSGMNRSDSFIRWLSSVSWRLTFSHPSETLREKLIGTTSSYLPCIIAVGCAGLGHDIFSADSMNSHGRTMSSS